jgi:hypothetical protein
MAGVISKESNNGTASNPRVNREEFRRVRKARILLRSRGSPLSVTEVSKVTVVTRAVSGQFLLKIGGFSL